ncbi:hypothetical protein BDZ91DRAFT_734439 [Kalaharituber pfeilii]|nr:hypothetical protein BDZ91DRAFT_734439 [Kalaharituber pfeilii]
MMHASTYSTLLSTTFLMSAALTVKAIVRTGRAWNNRKLRQLRIKMMVEKLTATR